ncbi:DUF4350 domain-containing protein [Mucilaginibacter boryungensis]|uniref:DUF4350 domain-containing protein n=1 Tax=Mucilaginibacter boryungensis TaxID=768480 RepID=A0ABR9XHJ4_9SPHI|nr:DUF4350 domain-containing protein [Mucilaginibacter boryungensis]MBE9666858.1 DUF4350 domain-containing protein [Mucilaginibacter boryungensis]
MRSLKLYIFLASVLLLLYVVAEYNRPKATDWSETFNNTEKIPFGTYILYNRLHDVFPGSAIQTYREPVYNVIADDSLKNANYIIICNELKLTEYDYGKLTQYIKKGNDVFIAANEFGNLLEKKLQIETNSEEHTNGQSFINFTSTSQKDSTYLVDHSSTNNYFYNFDTLKTTVLGKNGYNHSTFVRINMGKGALYLNANPKMFTNYSLLQSPGISYSAKALSYLKTGKTIAWDEYYSKGIEGEESSMRVFLSHAPLRWAFYLVIGGLMVYVFYQMKRRQRIIPIIEPVANTTVDFVTVVGQVYYEQHDNRNIAQKKVAYFLEHIRTKYNLKTNVHDAEFMETLANKSGVQVSLIQALFYQVALIQNGHKVDNSDLITLNQNIEQFYFQSS